MTARPAAPGERTATLDVTLLGREYKVACKESERAELLDAVAFVDRRMREIRDAGKSVAGVERVAVMAALNIAHDLLRERRTASVAPVQAASKPLHQTRPLTMHPCGVESPICSPRSTRCWRDRKSCSESCRAARQLQCSLRCPSRPYTL